MAYSGITASLNVGGSNVAYISNFSVEETRDMVEISRFGQSYKEKRPALYSWTASADGTADFADALGQSVLRKAMLDGTKVDVKFYLDADNGVYLSGSAFVESFSVEMSAEDQATVSISLSGTDALALTNPANA